MSTPHLDTIHLQPESLRNSSSTQRLSTSTTNPYTPGPSPTSPHHSPTLDEESEPTLHRVGSMERTRTWAEEVARQRKLNKQVKNGSTHWNISTNIIDAMMEGVNYSKRGSSGRLRPTEDAIHVIERKSASRANTENEEGKVKGKKWNAERMSSEDEAEEKPASFRYRDLRRSDDLLQGMKGMEPALPPTPGRAFSKSSLLSPPSPTPPPRRSIHPVPVPPKPKQAIPSIDEIIQLHSGAMSRAETDAVDRAKLEIARASPASPSTASSIPLTSDPSPPTERHSDTKSSPLELNRVPSPHHNETSPRILTKSHTRPTPLVPERTSSSPGAKVAIIPARTTSVTGSSDLTRTSTRTTLSSADSFRQGILTGQALLDKLEEGSSRPLSPVSSVRGSAKRVSFHPDTPTPRPLTSSSHRISKSIPLVPSSSDTLLPEPESDSSSIARYLHSPHLNTILHLPRPYPDKPLRVSLAQVGSPHGHPVLVFLGLGCVRYLIALYEDLACAYNLRLICIDRWGYGKTDEVPMERRGPVEWAQVVERVLDELGVRGRFGVMAHSAGAVYASAVALRMKDRVVGRLCFLAPWVNVEVDGGYKWLKWVPNGVIKSAVAADWHLQSYILGKPLSPSPNDESTPNRSESPVIQSTPEKSQLAGPSTASKIARRASQAFGTRMESPSNALSSSSTSSLSAGIAETSMGRSPRIRNLNSISNIQSKSDGSNPALSNIDTSSTSSTSMQLLTPCSKTEQSLTSDSQPNFGPGEGFSLTAQTLSSLPTSPSKPPLGPNLTHALTQASHHESEPGTTSDLLRVILNRPYRAFGIAYPDLKDKVGVDVWWGEEDDKVGEKGMRWLEDGSVLGARLRVVNGEGHNLMTCSEVLLEVFESLRKGAA